MEPLSAKWVTVNMLVSFNSMAYSPAKKNMWVCPKIEGNPTCNHSQPFRFIDSEIEFLILYLY